MGKGGATTEAVVGACPAAGYPIQESSREPGPPRGRRLGVGAWAASDLFLPSARMLQITLVQIFKVESCPDISKARFALQKARGGRILGVVLKGSYQTSF